MGLLSNADEVCSSVVMEWTETAKDCGSVDGFLSLTKDSIALVALFTSCYLKMATQPAFETPSMYFLYRQWTPSKESSHTAHSWSTEHWGCTSPSSPDSKPQTLRQLRRLNPGDKKKLGCRLTRWRLGFKVTQPQINKNTKVASPSIRKQETRTVGECKDTRTG